MIRRKFKEKRRKLEGKRRKLKGNRRIFKGKGRISLNYRQNSRSSSKIQVEAQSTDR